MLGLHAPVSVYDAEFTEELTKISRRQTIVDS